MRLLIVLVFLVAVAGCTEPEKTPAEIAAEAQASYYAEAVGDLVERRATRADSISRAGALFEADGLAVTSAEWDKSDALYIAGTVENTGPARSYAAVTLSLYDESGATVGTAIDNVGHIDAGGTWRFRAPVLQDEAGLTFRVTGLVGR